MGYVHFQPPKGQEDYPEHAKLSEVKAQTAQLEALMDAMDVRLVSVALKDGREVPVSDLGAFVAQAYGLNRVTLEVEKVALRARLAELRAELAEKQQRMSEIQHELDARVPA